MLLPPLFSFLSPDEKFAAVRASVQSHMASFREAYDMASAWDDEPRGFSFESQAIIDDLVSRNLTFDEFKAVLVSEFGFDQEETAVVDEYYLEWREPGNVYMQSYRGLGLGIFSKGRVDHVVPFPDFAKDSQAIIPKEAIEYVVSNCC